MPFEYDQREEYRGRVSWLPEAEELWEQIAADEPLTRRLTDEAIDAAEPPGSVQRTVRHLGSPSGSAPGRRPTPRPWRSRPRRKGALHVTATPSGPPEADETEWERRKRLAAVFGDTLPDTTSDERDADEPSAAETDAGRRVAAGRRSRPTTADNVRPVRSGLRAASAAAALIGPRLTREQVADLLEQG